MKILQFLCLSLLPSAAFAQSEEWFARKAHAEIGGQLEVRLEDGTRCDLLTDTHAYEVESASNWKEAIGQSLHYALLTDRKAGIILILIMQGNNPERYLRQLEAVIEVYGLPIEVVTLSDSSQ